MIDSSLQSVTRWQRNNYSHSPAIADYEVTRANGNSASAPHEADPSGLSTAESLELIDQLAQFPRRPLLMLTGSDPLARWDIHELIEYAANRGLKVAIKVHPTPLVTPEVIGRLAESGVSRLVIDVDRARSDTIDNYLIHRLRILANAHEAGVSTQVNTMLKPANFDQIDRMAGIFGEYGVGVWSVSFLVPTGTAENALRLSRAEYEVAFAKLWNESQRQSYTIETVDAPQYQRYVILHQLPESGRSPSPYTPMGLNDGRGRLFINHAGLIHPGGSMPIVCGMFPMENVVRVYQDSPVFRKLRDPKQIQGKCHDCEFRHFCGGSRARAYAVTGNPLAQEPDCCYVTAAMRERFGFGC